VRAPALISSGWWVLAAAVAVSVLVSISVLQTSLGPPGPEIVDPISFEPCLVEREDLVKAMARDGVRAITGPATVTPEQVDRRNENERGKLLVSSDRVIGVEVGGEARAYPLRLLRWHEAVNDVLGGRPIAVTYSPLSGAMAVWDRRRPAGDPAELAVSGWLHNSNTLLYDRRGRARPSSLWHQLTGEAVAGPAAGERLEPLPSSLQTWADWRRAHPETTIMAPDKASKRLYKRDPYHSYRGSDILRFPVEPLAPEGTLALKDLVAIVTHNGREAVFALPYLKLAVGAPRGSWAALLDDTVHVIDFDTEAGTFAIAPRDPGHTTPPVRFAYWFEWYALDPGAAPLP
jgi:hypothetical protein